MQLKTPRDFALEHWNKVGADIDVDDAAELLTQDRADIRAVLREGVEAMPDMYPVDIFPEPWAGWQEDIDALAKSKGRRIDCISAEYARWQNKVTRDDILTLIDDTLLPGDVSK